MEKRNGKVSKIKGKTGTMEDEMRRGGGGGDGKNLMREEGALSGAG